MLKRYVWNLIYGVIAAPFVYILFFFAYWFLSGEGIS